MLNLSGYKRTENKSYITIERTDSMQIGTALTLSGEKDFAIIPYHDTLDDDLKRKFDVDEEEIRRIRMYALVILNYSEDDAIEMLEAALDDEDTALYLQEENRKINESFLKMLDADLKEKTNKIALSSSLSFLSHRNEKWERNERKRKLAFFSFSHLGFFLICITHRWYFFEESFEGKRRGRGI